MSDAMKHGHHAQREAYEREDLTARSVFSFLIGLAVMGVLVFVFLKVMIGVLESYNRVHQPVQNPLVAKVPGETREVAPGSIDKFPKPQLEENEFHDLRKARDAEEEELYTYGYVDKNAGTVHIPIERAMQLIVERGLPTQVKAGVAPASVVNTAQRAAAKADTAAKPNTKTKK